MYIFIDLDGTLVDYNIGKITDKTKKALVEAKQAGHKVFLNTGRPAFRLGSVDLSLFDGYIAYSGGLVIIDEKIIFQQFIDSSILREIVSLSNKKLTDLSFMGARMAYYSGKALEYLASMPDGHEKGKKIEGSSTDFESYKTDKIYKVGLYCKEYDDINDFHKHFDFQCSIVYGGKVPDSNIKRFELTPNGINKYTAVEKILDYYHDNQAKTVGIGDSWNDLEMIEGCDVSVVMGSAPEGLKQVANYVTESSENEGVYHALQWLMNKGDKVNG